MFLIEPERALRATPTGARGEEEARQADHPRRRQGDRWTGRGGLLESARRGQANSPERTAASCRYATVAGLIQTFPRSPPTLVRANGSPPEAVQDEKTESPSLSTRMLKLFSPPAAKTIRVAISRSLFPESVAGHRYPVPTRSRAYRVPTPRQPQLKRAGGCLERERFNRHWTGVVREPRRGVPSLGIGGAPGPTRQPISRIGGGASVSGTDSVSGPPTPRPGRRSCQYRGWT